MATQGIAGLFGPMMSQEQLDEQRALQFAQLDPRQQRSLLIGKGAAGVGRSLAGMFGVDVQDPQLKRADRLRQLASQFDINTPEGLRQMASAVQQEDPQASMELARMASQMELEKAKMTTEQARTGAAQSQQVKAEAETAKLVGETEKEARLQQALATLPPDATDSEVESALRQFGKPDQILKTIERRQTAEANRQAKLELEREKAQLRAEQQKRDQEFRQQMAAATASQRSALTGIQQELALERLENLRKQKDDKAQAQQLKVDLAKNHAAKVITDVQDASSLVGGMTTGLVGKTSAYVPGTDAYNLNQRLLTIKANLGFDRLQQMRDASPTGGALGQVAVQELNALQATVGSLEIGQDRKELSKNLQKIEHHYNNWSRTLQGLPPISMEEFMKQKQPVQEAPPAAQQGQGGWSIRPVTR